MTIPNCFTHQKDNHAQFLRNTDWRPACSAVFCVKMIPLRKRESPFGFRVKEFLLLISAFKVAICSSMNATIEQEFRNLQKLTIKRQLSQEYCICTNKVSDQLSFF